MGARPATSACVTRASVSILLVHMHAECRTFWQRGAGCGTKRSTGRTCRATQPMPAAGQPAGGCQKRPELGVGMSALLKHLLDRAAAKSRYVRRLECGWTSRPLHSPGCPTESARRPRGNQPLVCPVGDTQGWTACQCRRCNLWRAVWSRSCSSSPYANPLLHDPHGSARPGTGGVVEDGSRQLLAPFFCSPIDSGVRESIVANRTANWNRQRNGVPALPSHMTCLDHHGVVRCPKPVCGGDETSTSCRVVPANGMIRRSEAPLTRHPPAARVPGVLGRQCAQPRGTPGPDDGVRRSPPPGAGVGCGCRAAAGHAPPAGVR